MAKRCRAAERLMHERGAEPAALPFRAHGQRPEQQRLMGGRRSDGPEAQRADKRAISVDGAEREAFGRQAKGC